MRDTHGFFRARTGVSPDIFRAYDRLVRALDVPEEAHAGCWIHRGEQNASGYVRVHVSGTLKLYAHRLSYLIFVGELGADEEVHHRIEAGCKSRACCNPAHLQALTSTAHRRQHKSGRDVDTDADSHNGKLKGRRIAARRERYMGKRNRMPDRESPGAKVPVYRNED
jgi:hypothetical protein